MHKTSRGWLQWAAALAMVSGFIGCGESDGLVPVSGVVTFEGNPIPEGTIQFRTLQGDQKAYAAPILDGKYEARVETGPASVEIRASRIIEGKFVEANPGEMDPVGEMYIPDKYNSRTELKVDIQAAKLDENFDLEPSPKGA